MLVIDYGHKPKYQMFYFYYKVNLNSVVCKKLNS